LIVEKLGVISLEAIRSRIAWRVIRIADLHLDASGCRPFTRNPNARGPQKEGSYGLELFHREERPAPERNIIDTSEKDVQFIDM
jgi:hypothetical protein